jgi:hypothetical protein
MDSSENIQPASHSVSRGRGRGCPRRSSQPAMNSL